MLTCNGRLQFGSNTTMFGQDGISTFINEYFGNSIGLFPRVTSIPRGYHAKGVRMCITAGSMAARPAQVTSFGGTAPINQGISIDAHGKILFFEGTAGLAALIPMTIISSPIHFGGSAGIYGLAFMDASGRILYFQGTAGLGAILTLDTITGQITFNGSVSAHSLAHLTINTSTGVMTEATISAAVWNSVIANYQSTGSTGKALSSAGAAGDPWTALLASYTDDATFGAFVKKLLTTGKFIGLK